MTLTPEQRAAAIGAMARAICDEGDQDPDGAGPLVSFFRWKFFRAQASAALDAALPIIEAALVSDKPGGDNG